MSLCVIIPVKPLAEAKQRLAPVLSDEQRAELARRLFQHVFKTVLGTIEPQHVIVVTRSPDLIDFAVEHGAGGLEETGRADLNVALAQATEFASGASKLLILASDLPLLCEDDVAAMAANDCAIAPDRHGTGTNALLWPANPAPGFHFGQNSYNLHRAAAIAAGLTPQIVARRGLAHDVDLPSDLIAIPLLEGFQPNRLRKSGSTRSA